MKRKHILYIVAAVLLIGGGTLSVVALTIDDKRHHAITVEATTENNAFETMEYQQNDTQSVSDEKTKDKDDTKTTMASTK